MIEDLIYDRTEADIINKTSKGYYNYNDINRIEEWTLYIQEILNNYNYPITLEIKMNWNRKDFLYVKEINRIKRNVERLKETYITYNTTPKLSYEGNMDFIEANRIEKILKDLDKILEAMESNFIYAGISNSDQNRMWQQRFRNNKTWNAQKYKLSQYLETDKLSIIATNNDIEISGKTNNMNLVQIDKRDDIYASLNEINNSMKFLDGIIGFECDYYELKNLIEDSSFENNQWNDTNNNTAYSTAEKLFGERSLYFAIGTTIVANIPVEEPIVGHIYYGRRYVKSYGDNQPADCRFEVYAGDGAGLNFVYGWNNGNFPEWTLCSEVLPVNDYFGTSTVIRCFNVNTTADYFIDGVMLIDLTACFGDGKEPNKEWCDSNIPYFNGTQIIKVRKGSI